MTYITVPVLGIHTKARHQDPEHGNNGLHHGDRDKKAKYPYLKGIYRRDYGHR